MGTAGRVSAKYKTVSSQHGRPERYGSRHLHFDVDEAIARVARPAVLVLSVGVPAALILSVAFRSGGAPIGVTAFTATLLAVLLAIRVIAAPRTIRAPSAAGVVSAVALGLFALWQLLSATWSEASVRAIFEFDRTVLYLLAFVWFATLPQLRSRWVLRGVAVAIVVVGVAALLTRVMPDRFPVELTLSPGRLSYPLTYWNGLAILVACGVVLCLHFASDPLEPAPVRVVAAGLVPALTVTIWLTQSRGGLVCAALGVGIYVLLGRPRGLVLALLAIVPTTYVAMRTAYDATALIGNEQAGTAFETQAREVGAVVLQCGVIAAVLRAVLAPFDARLAAIRTPRLSPRARVPVVASIVVGLLVVALAAGAPARAERQVEDFLSGTPSAQSSDRSDPRQRLTNLASPGRVAHWEVLLDASRDERLLGTGAGTFELAWNRDRQDDSQVTEAHSLYVETLGELGVIGLAALAVALVAALVAIPLGDRARRPGQAAAAAVVIAWMVHAAVDWDWELPAASLPVFILAGTMAAGRGQHRGRDERAWAQSTARVWFVRLRVPLLVAVCLLLALLPARTALSQSQLDRAIDAYEDGDCRAALEHARSARAALDAVPETYSVRALCEARAGRREAALSAARMAVERDPGAWEHRYNLALVQGATGRDPGPALRQAAERSPRDLRVIELRMDLRAVGRRGWRDVSADYPPMVAGFEREPLD